MNAAPLLLRELRLRSRRASTWRIRAFTTTMAVFISLGVIGIGLNSGRFPDEIGRLLYQVLTAFGAVCTFCAGPLFTADCISREKREETLGLLLLTPLRGGDVVLAKFVNALLPACYSLLAFFPVLALAFLLGGVTLDEYWRAVIFLSVLLCLSLSVGMLLSTLCRHAVMSVAATLGVLLYLLLLPLWSVPDLKQFSADDLFLALPSPTFAAVLLPDAEYLLRPHDFWASLSLQLFMSMLFLIGAGLIVSRFWENFLRIASFRSLFRPLPSLSGQTAIAPLSQHRVRLRHRLLDENPALWPAARRPLKAMALWVVVGGGIAFTAAAILVGLKEDESATPLGGLLLLLHLVVKVWLSIEAGRQANEDTRNGVLELMLVTPLTAHQIIHGWLLGLKRLFLLPVLLLVLADFAYCLLKPEFIILTMPLLILFLADLYTISWVGVWMGARHPTPISATARTWIWVLGPPWVMVLLCGTLATLLGMEVGLIPFIVLYFLIGYFTDMLLCTMVPERIVSALRRG